VLLLGLTLEIFAQEGVDSLAGRSAAAVYGCTETTLYVLALYFASVGVRKPRYSWRWGFLPISQAFSRQFGSAGRFSAGDRVHLLREFFKVPYSIFLPRKQEKNLKKRIDLIKSIFKVSPKLKQETGGPVHGLKREVRTPERVERRGPATVRGSLSPKAT